MREIANRRLGGSHLAMHAPEYPAQHAQVLAKTGPQELAFGILAEPVHPEDQRRLGEPLPHTEPVAEIVSHVVAAKRQHGHRITPYYANRASCRGRGLRRHRGAEEYPMLPVERLIDQRNQVSTAATEQDRRDWHTGGSLPLRRDRR